MRFDLHAHPICGDCKEAHLFTCHHTVNILKSCVGSCNRIFSDARQAIAPVDLLICRKYNSLNLSQSWPLFASKYINMSSIQVTFSHLAKPSEVPIPVAPRFELIVDPALYPHNHRMQQQSKVIRASLYLSLTQTLTLHQILYE